MTVVLQFSLAAIMTSVSVTEPVEAPRPWPNEVLIRAIKPSGQPDRIMQAGRAVRLIDRSSGANNLRLSPIGFRRSGGRYLPIEIPRSVDGLLRLPTATLTEDVVPISLLDVGGRLAFVRLTRDEAWKLSARGEPFEVRFSENVFVRGPVDLSPMGELAVSKPRTSRDPNDPHIFVVEGILSISITLRHESGTEIDYWTEDLDKYAIALPPGHYELATRFRYARPAKTEFEVAEGVSEVTLPPLVLRPDRLALLIGKTAPPLQGIDAWAYPHGSEGSKQSTSLEELRNKVVLLEFWGVWCGPCIHEMPELMALHDRYSQRGLAIVAIHNADRDEPVTTDHELGRRLVSIKESFWGDRDLPFPVGLTSLPEGDDEEDTYQRGLPAGDYGITVFPTTVLIGRDGAVIGRVGIGRPSVEMQIEAALSAPLVADKPIAE